MGINWLGLGFLALTKIPLEKMLIKRRDPLKAVKELEAKLIPHNRQPSSDAVMEEADVPLPVDNPVINRVTTSETIQYQKRELGKEIMLLEKHLQQKCKINGKACDCCEKHPIVIEGLAQETLGMTGDELYEDVIAWAKKITPVTTEQASRSGQYDDAYPKLAVEARNIRKRIMGTADIKALLSPTLDRKVDERVEDIINLALNKEGGVDDGGNQETV